MFTIFSDKKYAYITHPIRVIVAVCGFVYMHVASVTVGMLQTLEAAEDVQSKVSCSASIYPLSPLQGDPKITRIVGLDPTLGYLGGDGNTVTLQVGKDDPVLPSDADRNNYFFEKSTAEFAAVNFYHHWHIAKNYLRNFSFGDNELLYGEEGAPVLITPVSEQYDAVVTYYSIFKTAFSHVINNSDTIGEDIESTAGAYAIYFALRAASVYGGYGEITHDNTNKGITIEGDFTKVDPSISISSFGAQCILAKVFREIERKAVDGGAGAYDIQNTIVQSMRAIKNISFQGVYDALISTDATLNEGTYAQIIADVFSSVIDITKTVTFRLDMVGGDVTRVNGADDQLQIASGKKGSCVFSAKDDEGIAYKITCNNLPDWIVATSSSTMPGDSTVPPLVLDLAPGAASETVTLQLEVTVDDAVQSTLVTIILSKPVVSGISIHPAVVFTGEKCTYTIEGTFPEDTVFDIDYTTPFSETVYHKEGWATGKTLTTDADWSQLLGVYTIRAIYVHGEEEPLLRGSWSWRVIEKSSIELTTPAADSWFDETTDLTGKGYVRRLASGNQIVPVDYSIMVNGVPAVAHVSPVLETIDGIIYQCDTFTFDANAVPVMPVSSEKFLDGSITVTVSGGCEQISKKIEVKFRPEITFNGLGDGSPVGAVYSIPGRVAVHKSDEMRIKTIVINGEETRLSVIHHPRLGEYGYCFFSVRVPVTFDADGKGEIRAVVYDIYGNEVVQKTIVVKNEVAQNIVITSPTQGSDIWKTGITVKGVVSRSVSLNSLESANLIETYTIKVNDQPAQNGTMTEKIVRIDGQDCRVRSLEFSARNVQVDFAADGKGAIEAVAYDKSGNKIIQQTITVQGVDAQQSITITSPKWGENVFSGTTVTGRVCKGVPKGSTVVVAMDGYYVTVNGVQQSAVTVNAEDVVVDGKVYSIKVFNFNVSNVPVTFDADGNGEIQAIAYDGKGVEIVRQTITVKNKAVQTSINITSPTWGSSVGTNVASVKGNVNRAVRIGGTESLDQLNAITTYKVNVNGIAAQGSVVSQFDVQVDGVSYRVKSFEFNASNVPVTFTKAGDGEIKAILSDANGKTIEHQTMAVKYIIR